MQLLKLVPVLALPVSLLVSASNMISSRRTTEPQASDVNLAAANAVHSSMELQSFKLFTGSPVNYLWVYSRRFDRKYRSTGDSKGFIIYRLSAFFEKAGAQSVGFSSHYNAHTDLEFLRDRKVLNMTVYAGDFIDAISYTTESTTVRMGGSGGTAIEQDVGNGVLMGFKGTLEDGFIKSLEAIFQM